MGVLFSCPADDYDPLDLEEAPPAGEPPILKALGSGKLRRERGVRRPCERERWIGEEVELVFPAAAAASEAGGGARRRRRSPGPA